MGLKYRACLKRYRYALKTNPSAVAEAQVATCPEFAVVEQGSPALVEEKYTDRFKLATGRTGYTHTRTTLRLVREYDRRSSGAGRHRQAVTIRELLIDWYSKLRHSLNLKIMCGIPKKVLRTKAQMMQQDYWIECMKQSVKPEKVIIDGKWLHSFLLEYRISVRRPNRKFKVSRVVLKERLEIFWLSVAKVRKLISPHFG